MKKYLDSNGLLYFWGKIKSYVATAISGKADKGTTLSNYGITDAKINNGVITLGGNTITPVTTETDPTVPSWAKAESKPTYTASEVGAVPTTRTINSKALSANVTLTTSDIENTSGYITISDVPEGAAATSTTPLMDGTAAVGTETAFARGDHRHPSDNTKVTANAAITGATKAKITFDAKGLVTAGADLTASDIPSLTLSKISDVTATAAELNVLDGITATTTELNYVDGVTSSIQTQLNAKAPTASPTFTGTPAAPTASAGTNTTQIATTAFVTSAVSTAVGNYILTSAKGAANGVCPLDANSLIDSSYLPSYVDDVVEAYPVSGATELSSTWLAAGSASGTVITPETGKIYVLMADSTSYAANSQFRWSGTAYIKMADGGVSEITNAEIDTIVAA